MSKARDLADYVSTGGALADGLISVSEINDLTATAAELNTLDGVTAGTVTASKALVVDANKDIASVRNVNFDDSGKAQFGASNDLQIYHDGSNSYIDDSGTGELSLRSNYTRIGKYTGETSATFASDGPVVLRHDNSTKFTTTSTGIDITGTADMDTLSIGGTAVTATAAEINYVDGVTSNIQTQLDAKSESGGGVNTFTANEALAEGDLVSLRSDGKVEKTTGIRGAISEFESGRAEDIDVAFDSTNNKVVIAYRDLDDSNQGKAIVGTVASDGTISYGTPVVFSNVTTSLIRITFDPDSGKVVIIYSASSSGQAIVGTVSGTSISFGTAATWQSSSPSGLNHGITYDTNVDRVIIGFRDKGNSNYGTVNVGTISGTDITFGTKAVFRSGDSEQIRPVFCSDTNRIGIIYRDVGASNKLAGFSATATTTTVGTFSSRVEFTTSSASAIEAVYDSNSDKVLVIARVNGVSEIRVVTVTSSAISTGTAVQAITSNGLDPDLVMNTDTNKVVVLVRDAADTNDLKFAEGTISGTTVTFGDTFTLFTGSNDHGRLVFDSNVNKVVALYQDQDDSYSGKSAVINPETNLGQWIGFANAAITSGSEGEITTIGGINEGQSGLTTNSEYYVQDDATIATTEVTGRLVGRATSATNVYVTAGTITG